jgi:hypothetical protein
MLVHLKLRSQNIGAHCAETTMTDNDIRILELFLHIVECLISIGGTRKFKQNFGENPNKVRD